MGRKERREANGFGEREETKENGTHTDHASLNASVAVPGVMNELECNETKRDVNEGLGVTELPAQQ
tara:strand:+ start:378 stop:575 length:198 start_codon:yes stop_codon:yes gene_type:complete